MDDTQPSGESKNSSLDYEETPIIDPGSGEVLHPVPEKHTAAGEEAASAIPEAARVFQGSEDAAAKTVVHDTHISGSSAAPAKKSGRKHIGTVSFVVLLFGLGIWLSMQFRSFFAPAITDEITVPTGSTSAETDLPIIPLASPSGTTVLSWQTYEVMNGRTRGAIPDVSYQLPGEVKAPSCDSQSCSSQGTNLPGGTRFTVAARGSGQLLPDFRGAILTDASGREFTMQQTVIGSIYAYEYTGDFTGRTGGGYAFTKIRGVLMPVSEALAIEFNHFSPAGITTDFVKDDVLFEEIIKTFRSTGVAPTSAVTLPANQPTATSAGF